MAAVWNQLAKRSLRSRVRLALLWSVQCLPAFWGDVFLMSLSMQKMDRGETHSDHVFFGWSKKLSSAWVKNHDKIPVQVLDLVVDFHSVAPPVQMLAAPLRPGTSHSTATHRLAIKLIWFDLTLNSPLSELSCRMLARLVSTHSSGALVWTL